MLRHLSFRVVGNASLGVRDRGLLRGPYRRIGLRLGYIHLISDRLGGVTIAGQTENGIDRQARADSATSSGVRSDSRPAIVALTRLIGFCEPSDFERMS